jgi:hypothetical protein
MHAHTQVFSNRRTAPATALAGLSGVNRYQPATRVFNFVGQQAQQLRPSGILHGLCQRGTGKGHAPRVQICDGDQAVGICQLPGQFVRKVAPLTGDPAMQAGTWRACLRQRLENFTRRDRTRCAPPAEHHGPQ